MKSYLVRHGQSGYNAGETIDFDSSLTPKGWEQVRETCQYLKGRLDNSFMVFTSPYLRCLQTAFEIKNIFKDIKVIVSRHLGECPDELRKNKIVPYRGGIFEFTWYERNGYDYSKYNTVRYLQDIFVFAKGMPVKSVIVSHLTTLENLINLLTPEAQVDNYQIPNASISLIENGKPVYLGMDVSNA